MCSWSWWAGRRRRRTSPLLRPTRGRLRMGKSRRADSDLPSSNPLHWTSLGGNMTKSHDQHLRQNLVYLLGGGGAHAKFDDVIKNLPPKLRGEKPEKFPHSPWMLLEHLRLA